MEAAEAAAAAAAARASATPPTTLPQRTPITMPQQQPTSPPPPPPQQPSTPPPQPPKVQPPPPPPSPQKPRDEPQPELTAIPTPQPEIQIRTPTTEEVAPPSSSDEPPRPTPVVTQLESPMVIKPSYFSPPRSPTAKQNKTTPTKLLPNSVPEPEPELETKGLPHLLPQTFSTAPDEKTITNSNGRMVSNIFNNKQQGAPTKEEKQLRLITMAGDNTGAVMDIGFAALRRLGHLIQHADGNGNGHGRKIEQKHADGKKVSKTAAKTKHMEAVVNSNVQGINNSIVLNSSTSQHSPGVHITFASNRKPKGGASSSSDKEDHSDHFY